MTKNKTPEYTRRAIEKYNKSVKRIAISIKLEDWEQMQSVGMTSKDIKPLVYAEFERRKSAADQQGAQVTAIHQQDAGAPDQHDNDALQLPFDF